MALKDTWTNKVDGQDDVLAEHINSIAQAVIEDEENIESQQAEIDAVKDDVKMAEDDIKQISDFMRNTNLIDLKFHQGELSSEVVSERIKFTSPVSSNTFDFGCDLGVIMYDSDGNRVGSSGLHTRVQEASLVKGATYIELHILHGFSESITPEYVEANFKYWDNIPYDAEVNRRVDYLETQVGDIDTALDAIIAIQNELIGGDA